MINCAVLDDEEYALDILANHIGQCDMLTLTIATTNTVEVLNLANSGAIDLLFLDINMPEISGLEIAKLIGSHCRIIFTTAYPDFALDGYELGVIDYLIKPISYIRFLKAVLKAKGAIGLSIEPVLKKSEFFYVKAGIKNSVIKIAFNEIAYIEGLQNYIGIHHGGKKTLAYTTLRDIELALPEDMFMRVHKSFIVALPHIARIEGNTIELINIDRLIIISESYKEKLWSIIQRDTLGKSI